MPIYGYCPRYEDFYLVVCNICSQAVKPQALRDHIIIRHNGACSSLKAAMPVDEKRLKPKRSSKVNPTAKLLGKLDINETYREDSESPIDVPRNDFSDNDSLEFKSNLFNKDYDVKVLKDMPVVCTNSSSSGSFMNIKEELSPLLKLNTKSEYIDNVRSHSNASLSYLPPPIPPDVYSQHTSGHLNIDHQHNVLASGVSVPMGSTTPSRRTPTPSMSPLSINAHSSAIGQSSAGRPSTPLLSQPLTPGMGQPMTPGRGPPTPGLGMNTSGIGPPTPGSMGPPTPGGMGPPTPGGLGPSTPGGLGPPTPGGPGPSTPGGLGPPTPGRGPPTPNMAPSTPGMGQSPPIIVQQGSGLIHTLGSAGMGATQIIDPQSPSIMQQSNLVALPVGSPYGPSMSPVATSLAYQTIPIGQTAVQSPLYSPATAHYQSGISAHQINVGALQTISNQGLQTLNLQALPQVMSNTNSQVGGICQDRMVSLNINDQRASLMRGNHSRVMSTEEEEVNRISAMLMRETESMTVPQQVTAHDVVEAQGLAGGGIRRGPLVANNMYSNQITFSAATSVPTTVTSYQHSRNIQLNQLPQQSSVPVAMNSNSINMATYNQLRDKLLETVSESDLNAVLNVTPDAPVIQGNNECFIGQNNLNSFSDNTITDQFLNISQIGNQGSVNFKTEPDISNVGQINSDLFEVGSYKAAEQQYSNTQMPIHGGGELSESDELAGAVGSITGINQESSTNNYTVLTSLLQQSTISSPLHTVSLSHSNLNSIAKTNSSEGITVVFESNPKNSHIKSIPNRYNQSIAVAGMSGNTLNHVSNELVRSDLVSSSNLVQNRTQNIITRPYHQNQLQQSQIMLKNVLQPNALSSEQYDSLTNRLNLQPQQTGGISINKQPQYLDQHHSSGPYTQTTNSTMTVAQPMESPKTKKRQATAARKNLPLKERSYNPEVHCGVRLPEDNSPCTRSLTCKGHTLSHRRAVLGRSKRFDELLFDHKTKGSRIKANKLNDQANFIQNTPPGASVLIGSNSVGSSMSASSMIGNSSPIIVKALSATHLPDNSPTPHYYTVDTANNQFHTTSPCNSYRQQVNPAHRDDLYVPDCPKPLSSCTYNSRKLGGFLANDHRGDNIRNALFNCLRRPVGAAGSIANFNALTSNPMPMNARIPERYNNVKPLLARKLQAAVPCSSSAPDCNIGVVYNGQLLGGGGVGQTLSIKRPNSNEPPRPAGVMPNAKPKSKKAKVNDGAINYVSNLVQIDPTRNKSSFPMVAVSVQNGINTPHTITLGNVVAGIRNPSAQSIRIHPQLAMKEAQADVRTSIGDSANIVLGSGMPSGGFVIADTLKPLKADPSTSIRIEGPKLIAAAPKGNIVVSTAGAGINLVQSPNSVVGSSSNTPILAQNLAHQGQYFFTTVPGNPNSQLLQPLRTCRMGKASGVKLLGTNQATVSGTRQPIVLQQDKEAS